VCQILRTSVNVCENYIEIKKVGSFLEHGVIPPLPGTIIIIIIIIITNAKITVTLSSERYRGTLQ